MLGFALESTSHGAYLLAYNVVPKALMAVNAPQRAAHQSGLIVFDKPGALVPGS